MIIALVQTPTITVGVQSASLDKELSQILERLASVSGPSFLSQSLLVASTPFGMSAERGSTVRFEVGPTTAGSPRDFYGLTGDDYQRLGESD